MKLWKPSRELQPLRGIEVFHSQWHQQHLGTWTPLGTCPTGTRATCLNNLKSASRAIFASLSSQPFRSPDIAASLDQSYPNLKNSTLQTLSLLLLTFHRLWRKTVMYYYVRWPPMLQPALLRLCTAWPITRHRAALPRAVLQNATVFSYMENKQCPRAAPRSPAVMLGKLITPKLKLLEHEAEFLS